MVGLKQNLKPYQPQALAVGWFPPTSSGCPEPHPTWPGAPAGMRHLQQLWAAVPESHYILSEYLPNMAFLNVTRFLQVCISKLSRSLYMHPFLLSTASLSLDDLIGCTGQLEGKLQRLKNCRRSAFVQNQFSRDSLH